MMLAASWLSFSRLSGNGMLCLCLPPSPCDEASGCYERQIYGYCYRDQLLLGGPGYVFPMMISGKAIDRRTATRWVAAAAKNRATAFRYVGKRRRGEGDVLGQRHGVAEEHQGAGGERRHLVEAVWVLDGGAVVTGALPRLGPAGLGIGEEPLGRPHTGGVARQGQGVLVLGVEATDDVVHGLHRVVARQVPPGPLGHTELLDRPVALGLAEHQLVVAGAGGPPGAEGLVGRLSHLPEQARHLHPVARLVVVGGST